MYLRFKKLIINLIVVLGFSFATNAQTLVSGNITYRVLPGTNNIEAIDYDEAGGSSVNIPTLILFGRYTVTSIGDDAFRSKSLTSVSIPNTVTSIGNSAFRDNSLISVSLGRGVTSIGTQAFYNKDAEANSLTSVTSFLVNPPTISSNVFRDKGAIELIIPGGSSTNYSTDKGWDGFKSVTETFANGGITTIDHIKYKIIGGTTNAEVIDYDEAGGTSVTIPSTIVNDDTTYNVTSIGGGAFKDNSLTSVSSLLLDPPTIESNVFSNKAIIDLTIPAGSSTNYTVAKGWGGFKSVTETFANGGTVKIDYIEYKPIKGTTNVEAIDYDETGGTEVTIRSSITYNGTTYPVTSIGDRAFRDKSLTSVSIPNSVTNIGFAAFERNSLTFVSIPNSVTSIGTVAFQRNSLASVSIGNSVASIGTNAFAQNALTSVSIPNSVESIGRSAFRWNNSLTSVSIGVSVTSIGDSAFSNNSLTTITSSMTNPPRISNNVFANKAIIDLTVPNGAAKNYTADNGWAGFKSVTESLANGQLATINHVDYEIIMGTTNVKVVDYDEAGGTSVTIPSSIVYDGTTYAVTSIRNSAFSDNSLTAVSIPNSVISIGGAAFSGNSLTSVSIPNSVTSIGGYAFSGNSLTSVSIPNSVTSIGDRAFYNSDNAAYFLRSVTSTSTSPATLAADVFRNRDFITLTIPDGASSAYEAAGWTGFGLKTAFSVNDILYYVTDEASKTIEAIGYSGTVKSVTIPSTVINNGNAYAVTSIGDRAFTSNSLTSVSIPNSVTSIGNIAFASNSLASVSIPNSVTSIGNSAFRFNSLTSVSIPNSVTSIGDAAFYQNTLASVSIGNSVMSIGVNAFSQNSLTSVTIPNSVTSIGRSAFRFNSLTSVSIGNSVTSIDEFAFGNNSLTSVSIPNSVTIIRYFAFGFNSLTSVSIGASVTSIEDQAFYNKDDQENSLTSVTSLLLDPPTISSNVFRNFGVIDLTIPNGSRSNYTIAKGWDGFKSISEETLNVENVQLEKSFKIFMVNDILEIKGVYPVHKVHVYNNLGQLVKESKVNSFSVANLQTGVYYLRVATSRGVFSKKIGVNM